MSKYKNFKHKTAIQVRFGDIDSMNHVNNAKYLTYIESARINYIKQVLGTDVDFSKFSVILAKAVIDFEQPITLGDDIVVYTRCSRFGQRSFDLEYEIVKTNAQPNITVANGHTVLVAYDYELKQTIQIPNEWKKNISSFEETNNL